MGLTKLSRLRQSLADRELSLQRTYNYSLASVKLGLFGLAFSGDTEAYIQSVDHPFFQFENMGDYKGFIKGVTKPPEMNITFLENDLHGIGRALETWDNLKWDRSTGILYPKAVYEDEAILTYYGATKKHLIERAGIRQPDTQAGQAIQGILNQAVGGGPKGSVINKAEESTGLLDRNSVRYLITGFYPISRSVQTLSDGDNGFMLINVTFNVDQIDMLL